MDTTPPSLPPEPRQDPACEATDADVRVVVIVRRRSNAEGEPEERSIVATSRSAPLFAIACTTPSGLVWHEANGDRSLALHAGSVLVFRGPVEIVVPRSGRNKPRFQGARLSILATVLFLVIMGLAVGVAAAWTSAGTISERVIAAEGRAVAAELQAAQLTADVSRAQRRAQEAQLALGHEAEVRGEAERESALQRDLRLANENARRAIALALQGDVVAAQSTAESALVQFRARRDRHAEMDLYKTLGEAMLRAGRFADAEHYFDHLLTSLGALPKPDIDSLIDAKLGLATAHRAQGRLDAAIGSAAEALSMARRERGDSDPRTVRTMTDLAALHAEQQDWPATRDLVAQIVKVRVQSGDPALAERIQLAEIELRLGHLDEAGRLAATLMGRSREIPASGGALLKRLAHVFVEKGRYSEAISLLESVELSEAETRMLARLYVRAQRYAPAETLYQTIITKREQSAGADDPELADCAQELGELYERQTKYGPAEAMYKLALAIREKTLGANHPEVGRSATALADLYNIQGRFAESAALSAMANEIRQRAIDSSGPPAGTVSRK